MRFAFLLGRIVFGGFFLYNGIHHFMDRKSLAQYAGAKKVPAPNLAVSASGAMLLIGGASILLGIKPKLGALAIAGFLAGVSPTIHDFWRAEDPAQRMNDMTNFAKNIALLGAALALMAVEEPWPASVPLALPESRRYRTEQIAAA
jgi:putative oxidoreductase